MVSVKKKVAFGVGGALIVAAVGFGVFAMNSKGYDTASKAVSAGSFKGDFKNSKSPIKGGVLKVSTPGTASDPVTFAGYSEFIQAAAVQGELAPASNQIFYTDSDGKVKDGGPANMKVDKDNKTVTITLRDNLKWSDGKDVTAKDVEYSLEKLATNEEASQNFTSSYLAIKGMEDFQNGKAKSISGIKFDNGEYGKKLTVSYSSLPAGVNWGDGVPSYALPYHDLKDVADDKVATSDKVTKHPLSFNAFKVKSVSSDSVVKYERNPYYWGKAARLKGIEFHVNDDQSKLENDLSKQKFDVVTSVPSSLWKDGNKDQLAKYNNAKGYASVGTYGSNYYEAYFNLGHYDKEKKTNVQDRQTPLQDANVRKAIGYAMNTGDIAKKYSNGFQEATNTIVSKSDLKKDFYNKSVKGYNSKSSGDPEKAGEYLKKAGYKKESDGYYYKDGKKLTITFMARTGSTTSEAQAKAYIAAWKAAGIDAKLYQDKLIDFATWSSIMTTGTNQDWDVTIAGWSEGTIPSFGQLWATSAKYNMGHVVSDKVAKNLSDTDDASSDTAMIQDIKDFQKLVVDDNAYVIPTTTSISASLVNGRVTGFTTANVNDLYAQLGVTSDNPTKSGNPRK